MADGEAARDDVFVWSTERSELTLARDGDSWTVVYLAQGPLLGPRHVVHEGRYQRATLAAWEVLSRVRKVTHDSDQGVQVARSAVRWMRAQGWTEPADA